MMMSCGIASGVVRYVFLVIIEFAFIHCNTLTEIEFLNKLHLDEKGS